METSKTQSDFITAFWILYDKKRIEKISIVQLCQQAGYHRTTFYANFKDIYDLLDKAIDALLEPARTIIKEFNDFSFILKADINTQVFFKLFHANNKYIGMLVKNNHHYILKDKIKEIIMPVLRDSLPKYKQITHLDYVIEYHLSALFGIITTWIQNNEDIPEKELVNLLYQISSQGVLTVLNLGFPPKGNDVSKNDRRLLNKLLEQL